MNLPEKPNRAWESIFYFYSNGIEKSKYNNWCYIVLFLLETITVGLIPIMLLLNHVLLESDELLPKFTRYLLIVIQITPQDIRITFGIFYIVFTLYIISFILNICYYYFWFTREEINRIERSINPWILSANSILWHLGIFIEKMIIPLFVVYCQIISNRIISYDEDNNLYVGKYEETYSVLHICGIVISSLNLIGIFTVCYLTLIFSDNLKLRTRSATSFTNSTSHLINFHLKLCIAIAWLIDPGFEENYYHVVLQQLLIIIFLLHQLSFDISYRLFFLANISYFRQLFLEGIYFYILLQMQNWISKEKAIKTFITICIIPPTIIYIFNKYLYLIVKGDLRKMTNLSKSLYYVKKFSVNLCKMKNDNLTYTKMISNLYLHSLSCERAECTICQIFNQPLKTLEIDFDIISTREEIISNCVPLFDDSSISEQSKPKYNIRVANKSRNIKASAILDTLFDELDLKFKNNVEISLYKGYYSVFLFGKTYRGLEAISYFSVKLGRREKFQLYHLLRLIEDLHKEAYTHIKKHVYSNIDIKSLIKQEWILDNYLRLTEETTLEKRIFWNLLLDELIIPSQIIIQGNKCNHSIIKSEYYANKLLHSPHTSISFFAHYLYFHKKVVGNEQNIFKIVEKYQQKFNQSEQAITHSSGQLNDPQLQHTLNISAQSKNLGLILNTSSQIHKLTGYNKCEIIEQNINILIPESMHITHNYYILTFLDKMKYSKDCSAHNQLIIRRKSKEYIPVHIRIKVVPNFINNLFQLMCIIHKLRCTSPLPVKITRKIRGPPMMLFANIRKPLYIFGFSKSSLIHLNLSTYLLDSANLPLESILLFTLFNINKFPNTELNENKLERDTTEMPKNIQIIENLLRPEGSLFEIEFRKLIDLQKLNKYEEHSPNINELGVRNSFISYTNRGIHSRDHNIYWGKLQHREWGVPKHPIGYYELVFYELYDNREIKIVQKYMKNMSITNLNSKILPEKEKMTKEVKSRHLKTIVLSEHKTYEEENILMEIEGGQESVSSNASSIISKLNTEKREYVAFQQGLDEQAHASLLTSCTKILILICLILITIVIIFGYVFTLYNMKNIREHFEVLNMATDRFGKSSLPGWQAVEYLNIMKYFRFTLDNDTLEFYQEIFNEGFQGSLTELSESHSDLQIGINENADMIEMQQIEREIFNAQEISSNGKKKEFELSLSSLINILITKTQNIQQETQKTFKETLEGWLAEPYTRLYRDLYFVNMNEYSILRIELDKSIDKYLDIYSNNSDEMNNEIQIGIGIITSLAFVICLFPLYQAVIILKYQIRTLKGFGSIKDKEIIHLLKNITKFEKLEYGKSSENASDEFMQKFMEKDEAIIAEKKKAYDSQESVEIENIKIHSEDRIPIEIKLDESLANLSMPETSDNLQKPESELNSEIAGEKQRMAQLNGIPTGLPKRMVIYVLMMIFVVTAIFFPPIYLIKTYFLLFNQAFPSMAILYKRHHYSEIISYIIEYAANANSTTDLIGQEDYKFDFYDQSMFDHEQYLDKFAIDESKFYPKFIEQIKEFKSEKYLEYLKTHKEKNYNLCKDKKVASQGLYAIINSYLNTYRKLQRHLISRYTFEDLSRIANEAFEESWLVYDCGIPGIKTQLDLFIEETKDSASYYKRFLLWCFAITVLCLTVLYCAFWKWIIRMLNYEKNNILQLLKYIPFYTIKANPKLQAILYQK